MTDVGACEEPPPAQLLRGIDQFNRREFFACHETLEEIWLAEPGEVRRLYEGILQVGVAFYHLERGNWRGAVALLDRGIGRLQRFRPACQAVDVERLVIDADWARRRLRGLGADRLAEFEPERVPRVRLRAGAQADPPTAP